MSEMEAVTESNGTLQDSVHELPTAAASSTSSTSFLSAANSASSSIIRCITGDCGRLVEKQLICGTCYSIFACCSIACYSKTETHRSATQHYRTCRGVKMTPAQEAQLVEKLNDYTKYDIINSRPCYRCGRCQKPSNGDEECKYETNLDCHHCPAIYCSRKCKEEDRKRHEEEGECVLSIKKQLPPQTLAPSVRSSILVPDLLAQTISFLSLYQWSLAGRVNHAWRNATLHPLAFPHLSFTVPIDSPSIGPLHRPCIRAVECEWRDDIPPNLISEYSHLRSFHCNLIDVYCETEQNNYSDKYEHLPRATLTTLNLMTKIVISDLAPLIRFMQLRDLSLRLNSNTRQLHTFAPILEQLTHLMGLKLTVDDDSSSRTTPEIGDLNRTAIGAILDVIALQLHSLSDLDISSYNVSVCQLITRPMPHVERFSLRDPHFDGATSIDDINAIKQLSRYLPGVTHLSLQYYFTKSLTCRKVHAAQVEMMRDAMIACVDGFGGPHLKSLKLSLAHVWHEVDSETDSEEDDSEEDDSSLTADELTRLLNRSTQLKEFELFDFKTSSRTPDEILLLSKLTPMLQSLDINLSYLLEDEIFSSSLAAMFESLAEWFPHLTSLNITAPRSLLPFAAPSSKFLSQQDSMPRLQKLHLLEFDLETHLPSLLRLLPQVDLIIMDEVVMSAERFFEYAQYRPLVFTRQSQHNRALQPIPEMRTVDEQDLNWFDSESSMHEDSILAPHAFPSHLHSHYHAGVKLSQQQKELPTSVRDLDDKDSDSLRSFDIDRIGLGRRRGGSDRGRGNRSRRGAGCTRQERQVRKSAWLNSHGWMFSRVKNWCWNYCELVVLTRQSIAEIREQAIEVRGRRKRERGGSRGGSLTTTSTSSDEDDELISTSTLFSDLPESLGYHRSSVWIYTHTNDATRTADFIMLAHRFGRFVDERC